MKNTTNPSDFKSGNPSRQGFYNALVPGDTHVVAEWREYDKKTGKAWYQHVGDTPTSEKKPVLLKQVLGYSAASKEDVAKALTRELTTLEKIDDALKSLEREVTRPTRRADHPPARRALKVGDKIYLGALTDCEVVALSDEERIVVFSYRRVSKRYGEVIDSGVAYMARHWSELIKKPEIAVEKGLVSSPLMFDGYTTQSVGSVVSTYLRGMADSQDYQRDYVWTYEDKQRFLSSLFEGREIGRFIFVRNPFPQLDDILDGKQRLSCLWQFISSELDYKGTYWDELSERDRHVIEGRTVQVAQLVSERYSRAQLLRIFLEVNVAGVPQTEEHLAKVRVLLAEELTKEAANTAAKPKA